MTRDDWLLAQLPIGMMEDDFFCRFVGLQFTGILEVEPVEPGDSFILEERV